MNKGMVNGVDVTAELERLRTAVRQEIAMLDRWAKASVEYGWSTHQVDAMRRRADELRRLLLPG